MDNKDSNPTSNHMNPYTIDPPSAPIADPVHVQMQTPVSYPNLQSYNAQPNAVQYAHPPPAYPQPPVAYPAQVRTNFPKVRDWLPWSIISIFVGGLLPGIIPLLFSLACRSKKSKNDFEGARRMGNFALISNILVTLLGIVALAAVIVLVILYPNYFYARVRY